VEFLIEKADAARAVTKSGRIHSSASSDRFVDLTADRAQPLTG
jgi:hypothetical protein